MPESSRTYQHRHHSARKRAEEERSNDVWKGGGRKDAGTGAVAAAAAARCAGVASACAHISRVVANAVRRTSATGRAKRPGEPSAETTTINGRTDGRTDIRLTTAGVIERAIAFRQQLQSAISRAKTQPADYTQSPPSDVQLYTAQTCSLSIIIIIIVITSLHFAWGVAEEKCILFTAVCVSVCPSPHSNTTARTRM